VGSTNTTRLKSLGLLLALPMLFAFIFGCAAASQLPPTQAAYSGPRSYMLAPAGADILIYVHFDKYRDDPAFSSAVSEFFGPGIDENVRALGLAAGVSRNMIDSVTLATAGSSGSISSPYRLVILDGNFSANTFLAKSISDSSYDYKGVAVYSFGNGTNSSAVAILGTGVAIAGSSQAVMDAIDVSNGTAGFITASNSQAFKLADRGSFVTFSSKPSGGTGPIPKPDFFALGASISSSGNVTGTGYALYPGETESSAAVGKIQAALASMQLAVQAKDGAESPAMRLLGNTQVSQQGAYAIISFHGNVSDVKAGVSAFESS